MRFIAILTVIVGRVSWIQPRWLRLCLNQIKRSPILFFGLLLVISLLIYGYYLLPKPKIIDAVIQIPAITPTVVDKITHKLKPQPLIVSFGIKQSNKFITQSVAPLAMIDKDVLAGIELLPHINGTWHWKNDNCLIFTPKDFWLANTKYKIIFDQKNFIKMPNYKINLQYQFITHKFRAKIVSLEFYQDLIKEKSQQIVATINFNYPVDLLSLRNHLQLFKQTLGNDDATSQSLRYSITTDKYKRNVYLRSENIAIPRHTYYMLLNIDKNVLTLAHDAHTLSAIKSKLLIPDRFNYLKIKTVNPQILRDPHNVPQKILNIETTLGVTQVAVNKSLQIYLLPKDKILSNNKIQKDYAWQSPAEIDDKIIAQSKLQRVHALPLEHAYATAHNYILQAPASRYLYIKLAKGLPGYGGFILNQDYISIIKVPEFPHEINFLHNGAVLPLDSEKKISLTMRGLSAVKFTVSRILMNDTNQLITQTGGDFNNPYFLNYNFNQQNISQIFTTIKQFDNSNLEKLQYLALDLTKYMHKNNKNYYGLFLLQAEGFDVEHNIPVDVKANRLILITNIGLIIKDNLSGAHDVFAQSIITGKPFANVKISVLGKNGLPLLTKYTNSNGRIQLPNLDNFTAENEPVVYLATHNNDVAFIPYNRFDRQLNYSLYDVGGIYTNFDSNHLQAYVFTDRGIYYAGESVHIAAIIKPNFLKFSNDIIGLPIQITVTDPRGMMILKKLLHVDSTGLVSFDLPTHSTANIGRYEISAYLVKEDQLITNFLGSTNIQIADFQPNTMRIQVKLLPSNTHGWLLSKNITAHIKLLNLYGMPAVNRKIVTHIRLQPKFIKFNQYPEYIFYESKFIKPKQIVNDNLADVMSNNNGQAQITLNASPSATNLISELTLFTEGFEADSGRSVSTQSSILISPLNYMIGYKPSNDLKYLKFGNTKLHFIAIDNHLNQISVNNLKMQLSEICPVSVLVKNPDGTLQYKTKLHAKILTTQPFAIAKQGNFYNLVTNKVGNFKLTILDQSLHKLKNIKYTVVGNSVLNLTKNATLTIKLSKTNYKIGENIELQINAPYIGSGLITIENDKVYAHKWFTTQTNSSIQTIKIPKNLQGNGYLNVTFLRSFTAKDILSNPLSYAVAPFSLEHDAAVMHINLHAPQKVRSGQVIDIAYSTDKPGKIIIFLVNEGVLQLTDYTTPDPLTYFFQKHALGVRTQQILDQILPKFIARRELSIVGGDSNGQKMLFTAANGFNPFKQQSINSVAYWSGILNGDPKIRHIKYKMPDDFNGSVRIMAIAVNTNTAGSSARNTLVNSDFIITPNMPEIVSPQDEFEVTATILNQLAKTEKHPIVKVTLAVPKQLQILDGSQRILKLSAENEKIVHFKLRALDNPALVKLKFIVSHNQHQSTYTKFLSIRPLSPYLTTIISGVSTNSTPNIVADRVLYPQYRYVKMSISPNPVLLVLGLQKYLDAINYHDTEQLVSKGLSLLVLASQHELTQTKNNNQQKLADIINQLWQRQQSNGSFSYWPIYYSNDNNVFDSIYAMHFLTIARQKGFNVSDEMFNAGLSFLKDFVQNDPQDFKDAQLKAYAIYLLTLNNEITTNYLINLQIYVEKNYSKKWQNDILSAYIASSYALLKNENVANDLIKKYAIKSNSINHNAQYMYLLLRHFPDYSHDFFNLFNSLITKVNNEELNPVFAGNVILALDAYQALEANNPQNQKMFYQLIQTGFDRKISFDAVSNGIEIVKEYDDLLGNKISEIKLGDEVFVHIKIRSLHASYINNIAITDLLAGGFAVVRDSITNNNEYVDIRNDKIMFFKTVTRHTQEIIYKLKAINRGSYTVPPSYAQDIYLPTINAHSMMTKINIK